jgi:hypothetical protein
MTQPRKDPTSQVCQRYTGWEMEMLEQTARQMGLYETIWMDLLVAAHRFECSLCSTWI